MHSGLVIGHNKTLEVIDCSSCRIAHLDPLPENPLEVYARLFYSSIKPTYLSDVLKYKDWWERLAMVEISTLEAHTSIKSKKLLDVGSGYGVFADIARRVSYDVIELEPAEQPRALRSKTHRVISDPIETADLEEKT